MRLITFENNDDSKKRFEVMLHGLIVLGNTNNQKGLTVLQKELSLLDKLEGVSKPCECGKTLPGLKDPDRELNFISEGDILQFDIDDHEFDILYDYISKVPWAIGESSRNALKTLSWLKNGSKTS